jgi:hypothetical protein
MLSIVLLHAAVVAFIKQGATRPDFTARIGAAT